MPITLREALTSHKVDVEKLLDQEVGTRKDNVTITASLTSEELGGGTILDIAINVVVF